MPKDPHFDYASRPERDPSPDHSRGPERKRRRKVLSCYTCRSRKLQCDRSMPACGRCTKAGQAANCLYIDDPSDPTIQPVDPRTDENSQDASRPLPPPAPSNNLVDRLGVQDRRIKQLEAALAQSAQPPFTGIQHLQGSKIPLTPESGVAVAQPPAKLEGPFSARATDSDTMLLRGRSFKTQFHGATHVGALIAYVPELAKFTKVTFETFPAFARIRQDMKALENRTVYAGIPPTMTTDKDLKTLLASKAETDTLVQLYLDGYESIYHVVHLPTFRKDYEEMWLDPNSARPHTIALVLVMTACSQLLYPATSPLQYKGNSSNVRERAIKIIGSVEDWIQTKSEKHVTILDFQIRFLLLVAKRTTVRKAKRQWTEANRFLNFCISAGLHRNPDLLRKPTSAYDKEMRRRIWAASCEFELQMAFERGMVSSNWPLQSDTPAPSNISDIDFDTSTEHLPAARPSQQFTVASWLAISHETLMLRHSLNTKLNNIRQSLSFDECKRYTEEIEAHIKALPHWIGTSSEGPRATLELSLRQYSLAIHNRILRQTTSQTERNFSRIALLEDSMRIVDVFKSLADSGPPALQLLRDDLVRAACSVGHVSSTLDPATDGMVTQVVNNNAEPLVEEVMRRLTDNIGRYGREQRQLWIVIAVNGFMKTARDPANKLRYMQEAVDKITKPYYRILAGQENAPSSVGNLGSTKREQGEKGFIEYLPEDGLRNGHDGMATGGTGHSAAAGANLVNPDDDPPLLDLEELAAWTFEDWAWTNDDFGSFGEVL